MSRPKLVRRVAISVTALVVVIAVAALIVTVGVVRRGFPQTSGRIQVAGLDANVTVLRDAQGVPQIYADSARDLFHAQGFVAAQDRFFQMDLRRHIASGRLSELVGPPGLEADKVVRTLGWRRVAEAELPGLAATTRRYLQAYADGVNSYIRRAESPSRMGVEYVALSRTVPGYRVERWTPADSLAWLKAVAWDMRGNYTNELTRARLGAAIPARRLAQLFPAYPLQDHAPILSARDWSPPSVNTARSGSAASAVPPALRPSSSPAAPVAPASSRHAPAQAAYARVAQALAAVPQTMGRGEGVGSNSFVVSGQRSTTGMPLLANDPHLGVGIPSIWYQAGLHCTTVSADCPFEVSGFSFAGLPGIVIGHNAKVAWGFTNLGADVSDFYLEQVAGGRYLRDGAYIPLTTRTETIKVAGGADVSLTVRSTVHGPVLSDVVESIKTAGESAPVEGKNETGSYDVSLAWTGLRPTRTPDAIFAMNRATDFTSFREAARSLAVPAQNLVYADVAGHIGYQTPGQIPIRKSATDGAPPGYWPAPGWKSEFDWKGFVPFEQLPTSYDPPQGFIVAANQAVTASRTPFLTTEWDYGYRSQRIHDLVTASPKVSPAQMTQIQLDTRNEFAPTLVRLLLRVDLSDDPFTKQAQNLLRGWDFTQPVGQSKSSAAAAYYNAVWKNLVDLTFNDELPAGLGADGGAQWMQAVTRLVGSARDAWWDNKLTANVTEDMTEVMRQSMVGARLDLTRQLGKNPGIWQWGRLHSLTLRHPVLGGEDEPGVLRMLVNRGPRDMPGGSAIVNANGWDAASGSYTVNWAPSMRMVVDLGNLDASRWVNQTGTSGHPYAPHYDDQVEAWSTGDMFDWRSTAKAVRDDAVDELTLVPSPSS